MKMQELPPGVAPNLAQLHSTMQQIEHACSLMQIDASPVAAEATIAAFHQSPRPYESCKYILENSQVANARFQAAGAIRDAAIREWLVLTNEEKKNLIMFCIHYVMKHSFPTEAYVEAKVSAVAAQLLKRGWIDFSADEKEAFFSQIKHSILGVSGSEVQFLGVRFLESLVSEFSPCTFSAMNLPAEFHKQCKSLFEAQCLKNFYCWAKDAALNVTDKILKDDLSDSEEKVCSAALRLMFQIMNWDFKPKENSLGAYGGRVNSENLFLKKFELKLVQPGTVWYDVLVSSGHIRWLLGLYETLRKRFGHDVLWFDSPLAVSSRQLIVQLCSLSGTIFPFDGQTLEKHLLQILSTVTEWVDPPHAAIAAIKLGKSESELLDGCYVLLSMATLTNMATFDGLLKSFRPYGTIPLLAMLTSEVANNLAGFHNEEEIWHSQVMDIMLETWNVLFGHIDFCDDALSVEVKSVFARLFKSLVDSQLKAAAASAFDDDCDSDHFIASILTRDERLSSYALIARAAADASIPMLTSCFSEKVSVLLKEKGQADVACTMEEIYWLILIAGHVLTDSGEGETVLVPDALHAQFTNVDEAQKHPVLCLSLSVINFAKWSLNPEMRAVVFSPRLMEALVWFLARWIDTYLMVLDSIEKYQLNQEFENKPIEHPSPSKRLLLDFSGENNQGKHLLDVFVQISATALISYMGETELQALTCHQLLPALVRRRNVCVQLVSLDSWRSLANAFANESTLLSVNSRLQRFLAETFVHSASSIRESTLTDQYIRDLLGSIVTYLLSLTRNDIKTVAHQPDVIIMVTCLLERLRGAARATEPRTQKAIFNIALAVMDPLLVLMDIYKDETIVICMILKFAVSLVDAQVIFLNPGDTAALICFCMRLLQIYSSHNVQKISISLSSGLQSGLKTDKYKDLRAMLQLLTNLCSKDLVDLSSASDGNEDVDISQVVYMGLHIVIPLISLEMLKYPKLCYQYFSLLTHMLELYPEKVIQLNDEPFKHIVGSIDLGIHHQDIDVVEMCLRAVNALASYHYKETSIGKEGLGLKATQLARPHEGSSEGISSHFLRMLMHLLLFEEFCMDLLGAAADALLPLLLCEQQLYQRLVCELIARQPNDLLKSRLTSSFNGLTGSNQISSSLDRPNRQQFRKNFQKFFVDISGLLRTK